VCGALLQVALPALLPPCARPTPPPPSPSLRDATDRCKIVDKHLMLLAPKHMETKFVKV
jgi:hypothetical protein